MSRRNVLIFHNAALGDFVLTWPLAMALGRLAAQSRIIYVTASEKGRLCEAVTGLEYADVEEGWGALFGDPAKLPDRPRRMIENAQMVVAYFQQSSAEDASEVSTSVTGSTVGQTEATSTDGAEACSTDSAAGADHVESAGQQSPIDRWRANVAGFLDGSPLLVISPNPPSGSATHVVDHAIAQLSQQPIVAAGVSAMVEQVRRYGVRTHGNLGLTPTPPRPRTGKDKPSSGKTTDHPSPSGRSKRVVIHPGSGSAGKNWPVEKFIAVADLLRTGGFQVCFAVGEVEKERFTADELLRLRSAGEVVHCPTLLDLLAVLRSADVYVGNDSGPTHLAAVLGRPTIALFGPASVSLAWQPIGPAVRVATFDATPEEVVRAVHDFAYL